MAVALAISLGALSATGCQATAAPLVPRSPTLALPEVCGIPACSDHTTDACADGLWPGGVIRYRWSGREIPWVRRAMDDWETLTHGAVHFELETRLDDPSRAPVLTLFADGGGNSSGYLGCLRAPTRCAIHVSKVNVYHELGHTITTGGHHFNRYDRRHYVTIHGRPGKGSLCEGRGFARCRTPELAESLDYGPFDYRSTMLYTPTHPDIARFDGSPIVPETGCGQGSFAAGRAPVGEAPSTCRACRTLQPNGLPSLLDASSVIERYLGLGDPGWKKFVRTVEEDVGPGAGLPFDVRLAPGVLIPASAGPAVEGDERGSVRLYARGSDDRLYTKQRRAPGAPWSAWGDLGAPDGPGSLSDPAVVSLAPGSAALVVRRGATLHLRLRIGEGWGRWSAIGAPASPPSSAPSVTAWGPDRLEVFVRGADDLLHRTSCVADCEGPSPRWTGWSAVPGEPFKGKPSAVARRLSPTEGAITVLVHRMDDRLGALTIPGAAGAPLAWEIVPTQGMIAADAACPECSSPAVGARDDGSLEVFVRGGDDLLRRTSWTSGVGWSARYDAIGGVPTSSPGVLARALPGARQAIAIVMAEETTAERFQHGVWLKEHAR